MPRRLAHFLLIFLLCIGIGSDFAAASEDAEELHLAVHCVTDGIDSIDMPLADAESPCPPRLARHAGLTPLRTAALRMHFPAQLELTPPFKPPRG